MKVIELVKSLPFPAAMSDLREAYLDRAVSEPKFWSRAYGWLLSAEVWPLCFQRRPMPKQPREEPPPTRHPDESDEDHGAVKKQHDEEQAAVQRAWKSHCKGVTAQNNATRDRLLRLLAWAYENERVDVFEQGAERLRSVWRYGNPERAMMEWRAKHAH